MNNDLTAGKPGKLILMFTLPLLIGNLFQWFYFAGNRGCG